MSLFQKIRSSLRDDPRLQRVVRNRSYLFSSSAVSAVLSVVQMIIVVRLLDVDEYGLATGIIMDFATSVNQVLSFRMSEVVVKYAGEALVHERTDRAAALIKGIGLAEAATSVTAYLVLVLLAPWAAVTFAKDASTAPLVVFYGLYLLANIVYETSVGALQTVNHFGRVARVPLVSHDSPPARRIVARRMDSEGPVAATRRPRAIRLAGAALREATPREEVLSFGTGGPSGLGKTAAGSARG